MSDDINSDVLTLAQKIADKVEDLIEGVETLDGNNWLKHADAIVKLNDQLQNIVFPETAPESKSKSEK
jgi:hypothetical protein